MIVLLSGGEIAFALDTYCKGVPWPCYFGVKSRPIVFFSEPVTAQYPGGKKGVFAVVRFVVLISGQNLLCLADNSKCAPPLILSELPR